ncbi:DUF5988 family protein [Embleya sp. AB8]|uniref:DUF5988 family protein n=1 Tax=Embleya sp. AB8 TaxID=3156304 RepID=UPI003C73CE66
MPVSIACREFVLTLEGGPPGMPRHTGVFAREVPDRVAVKYRNGREHFEFTGRYVGDDAHRVALFRWIYSTKIAE